MRDLSRKVAEAYLEQRQQLEYPWLEEKDGEEAGEKPTASSLPAATAPFPVAALPAAILPAPFLLEVGTEELPVGDLDAALEQLRLRVPELLEELRLGHGRVQILGTPRRLVVYVEELAPRQTDLEQVVKGPPAARAFGADGTPTPAAEGFARSRGVKVSDLQICEMDGGQYVTAVVRQTGRPVEEVLADSLPGLLAGLRFDKPMRWNSTNVAFSRPIRWLLALYGERVVPFEYAGLTAGRSTRGLRFHEPMVYEPQTPQTYFESLAEQGILLEVDERRRVIQSQIGALAAGVGGEVLPDPNLLAEVANLVEAPTALRGAFDPSHLQLPDEVLISVMKKHQRYFPVSRGGKLLPFFIVVRNGDSLGLEVVADGNEHVIRARFADAAYFVREDLKRPLEAYLARLKTMTFQARLGSMFDKVQRIQSLVEDLIPLGHLETDEAMVARRAAALCKADLATHMVVEMTSLQGVMGRHYARVSGETPAVAQAIFEHYLPRSAGDRAPEGRAGLLVGLADRLDTLAGLFAAGLAPSGNKDPFAQRRAALGLVQNLIAWDLDLDLRVALQAAAAHLPIESSAESQAEALIFIIERLRNVLLEAGWRYDVVDAVLAAQGASPARAARAVKELTGWVTRPDWNTILPAYARCVRITRDQAQIYPLDAERFIEPEEQDLHTALLTSLAAERRNGSVDDLMQAFLPMIPRINTFFDKVLVMAEDAQLRENRLGLVQRIAGLATSVADLSRLEGF
jgi:glycyl-tRNA synthetase